MFLSDHFAPESVINFAGIRTKGRQVKTDRIDAAQLAQFYTNDLLTYVSIPELKQEQDRDLLRSRQKLGVTAEGGCVEKRYQEHAS